MFDNVFAISVQLLMNVPYTAIHFATYESCKTYFGHGDEETLLVQVSSVT